MTRETETTPEPGVLQARCMLMFAIAGDAAVRLADGMDEPQRSAVLFVIGQVQRDMADPDFRAKIERIANLPSRPAA
jgi:hypothetical protein